MGLSTQTSLPCNCDELLTKPLLVIFISISVIARLAHKNVIACVVDVGWVVSLPLIWRRIRLLVNALYL